MGFVLYVSAFGVTLLFLALITTIKQGLSGVFSVGTVIDTVLGDLGTLMLFSGLWIIFVEVYKALG